MQIKIGIIGGSGLDNPKILNKADEYIITTPWGAPSSALKSGDIGGVAVVLLARHGREHTIPPTQVNNRANIHALKAAGCSHIIASTAVGSLREEIGRGDMVVLDQFIDFTRRRPLSFHDSFPEHNPVHISMAEPFDGEMRKIMIQELEALAYPHHSTGTVITIEGPRFSTRAESNMYRIWGADVVNMSIAPEAILAAEAQIPYCAVAMSTDYDSWKNDEAPVTWEDISKVMGQNVDRLLELFKRVVPRLG